ncbi:MAG: substrate-binding domain-containing protein [Spirochaetia bacterium]
MKQRTARFTTVENKAMSQEPMGVDHYLYERIYRELKEEILSGKYKKGDWFPPERVLKDRFTTTHLTVRNALAKLVLEGYIERYSGKGTLVIYSKDRPAAPPAARRFPFAHLILASIDEANALLLEALEAQLRKIPLPIQLSCHHDDVMLEQSMYRQARGNGALVILQPAGSHESVLRSGEPLSSTVVVRAAGAQAACPQIVSDDQEAGRVAMRCLLSLGYRLIGMLDRDISADADSFRQGCEQELAASGVPADALLVERCPRDIEAGSAAAGRILARRAECRAFACATDEAAAGAARGLRKAGLLPGRDCAVIGCGNTRLAQATDLTSVDPLHERMAELVMAAVVEGVSRGAFPAEISYVTPELRLRGSCAPFPFLG